VKTILVDIDVILDVLAKREPFYASAARLWAEIESGHARAYLAAHTVTTIFYLVAKARGKEFAKSCVGDYKKSEIPATTPDLFLATLKFSG